VIFFLLISEQRMGGRPGWPACGGDDCRRPRARRWLRAEGKWRGPRGGSIPPFTLGGDGARRRISGRQQVAGHWWWRRCAVLKRERGEMWLGDGRRGEWCRPQFIGAKKRWKGRAEHVDHVRPAGAMVVLWLDSAGVKTLVAGSGSGAMGKDPSGCEATRGGMGRKSSTRSSCSSCNGGSAVWPWWVGRDSRRTKSVAATRLLNRTRRAARRRSGSGRRVMAVVLGPILVVFC
jgi:hypothetical protein